MNIEKFNDFLSEHTLYNDIYYNINGGSVELKGNELRKKDYREIGAAYEKETEIKLKIEDVQSAVYVYAEKHKKEFDTESIVRSAIENDLIVSKLQYCEEKSSLFLDKKEVTTKIYDYAFRIMTKPEVIQAHPDSSYCEKLIIEYAKQHPYKEFNKESRQGWQALLKPGKNTFAANTANNAIIYFSSCDKYAGKFAFNEFTQRKTYDGHNINDSDESEFRVDIESDIEISQPQKISDGVTSVCIANSYHPFKRILENIYWDQVPRLETAFIKYLGVKDTPLYRSMTKKWFYGAIKRIYEPGCPMDSMIIIHDSTQGTGKSKFFERLVSAFRSVDSSITYGFDSTINFEPNRDNIAKMNRALIVLFDECAGMLKTAPEQMKSFISNTQETVRLAYDKNPCDYLRHCVFAGTTNETSLLKDYTTDFERRFWIMVAQGERHTSEWWQQNLPDSYILQIWAEAYHLYKTQPKYNYNTLSGNEENELKEIQQGFKTSNNDDVLMDMFSELLESTYEKSWYKDYTEMNKTLLYHKCEEITSISTTPEQTIIDTFIEANPTNTHTIIKPAKIDKIPVSWLKRFAKEEWKINRPISTNYLKALTGWKVQKTKYRGNGENKELLVRP